MITYAILYLLWNGLLVLLLLALFY